MEKRMLETVGVFFWGLVLVAVLAYIGNSVANAINADVEKLQKAFQVTK